MQQSHRTHIALMVVLASWLVPFGALAQSLTATTIFKTSFSGNRVGFSAPSIAEIDGDPSNGKEIVAVSTNGVIAVVRATGSVLWEARTPDSECKGPSQVHASPSVAPLFGDGVPYVIVGYGSFAKRCNGGVAAYRGTDGALLWNFSTKAFAKSERFWAKLHAVFSSPQVADTDGDGRYEIGFGSFDRNVYLLNADGSVRWYYNAADTVWSSPTFVNLDGTPELEMVIGTDISQNKRLKPPTANGGILYAFRTTPNPKRRYGFRDREAFLWMTPVEQVLFSSPAAGDVIPSIPGDEIVINSGCYFPERTNQKTGRWTRVFRGSDGLLLQTFPIEACSPSSPALGDVDGDGVLDIVVTVNGARQVGGDGASRLTAFSPSRALQLWSIIPRFRGSNYSFGGNFISPVVADSDRNGSSEVIVPVSRGIGIYNGIDGSSALCGEIPCDSFSELATGDIVLNRVAVGDVDGNGRTDIVAAGRGPGGAGTIYRWEIGLG